MKTKMLLFICFLNINITYSQSTKDKLLDSLWNNLVSEKGCLAGNQNYQKGMERRSIFDKVEWNHFLKQPKKKVTALLISKLADSTKTEIHTCPFFNASNGEIAVYSLQKIYKENWYDFKFFKEYQNKKITSAAENEQAWLIQVLRNKNSREKLTNYWQELKNKK